LLPAGHIIGSAMLHLTRHSDGATLLYTGDYKLRAGLTTPQARLMQADTLIMETTFGLPRYLFPPTEQIVAGIVKFVREAIADEHHPVLLGYSLGKAQELLAAVRGANVPVMLHQSVMNLMPICADAIPDWPTYRAYDANEAEGHALIFPPTGGKTAAYREMKRTRTAMITGWAIDPGMKYRYGVDEVFPLSDHADYHELLRTVEEVKPKRIYTVHGYTREFSAELRRRGYDAWSLAADDQMELCLI
jgi:DNA ligase-1